RGGRKKVETRNKIFWGDFGGDFWYPCTCQGGVIPRGDAGWRLGPWKVQSPARSVGRCCHKPARQNCPACRPRQVLQERGAVVISLAVCWSLGQFARVRG